MRCCGVVIAVVVGVRYASKPEGSVAVAVAFGLLYVSTFWGDDRYTGVSDYCLSSWLVSGMAARSVIMLGRGRECKYMYHNPPTVDTWMTSGGESSLELLSCPTTRAIGGMITTCKLHVHESNTVLSPLSTSLCAVTICSRRIQAHAGR